MKHTAGETVIVEGNSYKLVRRDKEGFWLSVQLSGHPACTGTFQYVKPHDASMTRQITVATATRIARKIRSQVNRSSDPRHVDWNDRVMWIGTTALTNAYRALVWGGS